VVDLTTGISRRVLQGHPSVQPDATLGLTIDGVKIESKRLDGTSADPIGGVTPLALDRKGEWLYFGPLRSTHLYRVKTEHLRNAALSSEKLAGFVEQYSTKPICAGITLDSKGGIYVSDLESKAIGMIATGSKQYKILASDPRLLWPDALCFGPDGRLCFITNTRRAQTTSARRAPVTPTANHLFKLQTPGTGRIGD
jgi:sugar lactone lactonase YvrE